MPVSWTYCQFPVQAGEVKVRAVQWSAALDGITETVTVPTGEQPATTVEFRDAPTAIHAIARHVTNEPRPLTPEAARRPPDRNALADRLPVLCGRSDFVVQPDGFAATDN